MIEQSGDKRHALGKEGINIRLAQSVNKDYPLALQLSESLGIHWLETSGNCSPIFVLNFSSAMTDQEGTSRRKGLLQPHSLHVKYSTGLRCTRARWATVQPSRMLQGQGGLSRYLSQASAPCEGVLRLGLASHPLGDLQIKGPVHSVILSH